MSVLAIIILLFCIASYGLLGVAFVCDQRCGRRVDLVDAVSLIFAPFIVGAILLVLLFFAPIDAAAWLKRKLLR